MIGKNPRKDQLKNKAKVLKEVIKDPLATQEEIAERAWISVWNVNDKLKKVEKMVIKDDRILGICDKDLEIVTLAQNKIVEKIKTSPFNSLWDIVRAADASAKRYSLLKWDVTDKDWGLKDAAAIDSLNNLLWSD